MMIKAPTKAFFDDARDVFIVDKLLTHSQNGKRSDGSGFKKEVWLETVRSFNDHFDVQYTVNQIKSRLILLRKSYDVFKKLRNQSGFGWDEEKQIVTAPAEVWDKYLETNKEAKQFKKSGFPLYNKMTELYDGQRAIGLHAVPSTSPNTPPKLEESSSEDESEDKTKNQSKTETDNTDGSESCQSPFSSAGFSPSMNRQTSYGRNKSKATLKMAEAIISLRESNVKKQKLSPINLIQEAIRTLQREEDSLSDQQKCQACRILMNERAAAVFCELNKPLRTVWILKELERVEN